jgi:spermidine/putrescine-binding protein
VPPPIRALRILAPNRSLPAAAMREFTRISGVQVNSEQWPVISNLVISSYDVVIAPSHVLTNLIRNSLIHELNLQSPISNLQPQRPYDPFNSFSVLASRGIIGVNARGVTPPQSWKEFFELAQTVPTHLPSLESLNAALKSFGESINTRNTYLRDKAQSLISNLQSFPLSQSQLAIAPPREGWNFVAPREGVEMREDSFCIPRTSTEVELAQRFIEFAGDKQKSEAVEGEMLSAFALV